MGNHWVRATKPLSRHALTGAYVTYQPGDWFEVKNQELRQLLERGMIDTTPQVIRAEYDFSDALLLVRDGDAKHAPRGLGEYGIRVVETHALTLDAERVVFYKPGARGTALTIALGLARLEARPQELNWEMVAMLRDHRLLARDVGTQGERDRTLTVVGDLRLPVYDAGVVWVRRTPATEEVIQLWQEELDAGADETHAFLRAIYTRRVLLCTLPANWIGLGWIGA